jgi:ubiquinone/menaquinone biosynthesis C-methylase UbiE
MLYDEEPARRIAAISDTAEMAAQRTRVIELLAPAPGWRVLDVGCGPGHLCRDIAAVVGPQGRVHGVDVSDQMLALAADPDLDLAKVEGVELPFDDEVFDGAVATQVYEFVPDLDSALAELGRVLRPGGRAVVLDTDWDSLIWHSSDPNRMRRVIDGWCERVADPHLPRTLAKKLREAGLDLAHCEVYPILDMEGGEHTYSAHQIEHLGDSARAVAAAETEAWAADLHELALTGEYFFSVNRYIFVAVKPARS